jgi:glutamate transport system substrate-binding protein
MKFRTLPIALAALALAAAACGESKSDIGGSPSGGGNSNASTYQVVSNPSFAAGSTMEKLSKASSIKVGVKADQPGIGNKNPATGEYEGFDIEVAKIIAGQLGLSTDKVKFVETVSKNREPFIQTGNVDIVIASYSITDKRKLVVSFAGPYYQAGQDLLIRKADQDKIKGPDDLAGKKVCSVTGSTPLANIEENYKQAKTVPFSTYTECVDQLTTNQVDAVTTDGAILLGYAAKDPANLQVVGKPFSTEKYGIGLKKDDKAFRDFINDSLQKSFDSGDWQKAYDATLGKSGSTAPSKPTLDRY